MHIRVTVIYIYIYNRNSLIIVTYNDYTYESLHLVIGIKFANILLSYHILKKKCELSFHIPSHLITHISFFTLISAPGIACPFTSTSLTHKQYQKLMNTLLHTPIEAMRYTRT